jgi:hypothetical protein
LAFNAIKAIKQFGLVFALHIILRLTSIYP